MVEAVYAAGHALLGAARLGVSQLPTLSHFAIFFTRTTRKRGAPERTGLRKRRAPESAASETSPKFGHRAFWRTPLDMVMEV